MMELAHSWLQTSPWVAGEGCDRGTSESAGGWEPHIGPGGLWGRGSALLSLHISEPEQSQAVQGLGPRGRYVALLPPQTWVVVGTGLAPTTHFLIWGHTHSHLMTQNHKLITLTSVLM